MNFLKKWSVTVQMSVILGVAATAGLGLEYLVIQSHIDNLKPSVESGSATCSGGNAAACDRVCVAATQRLVVVDTHGHVLKTACVRSGVTPKSTKGSRGVGASPTSVSTGSTGVGASAGSTGSGGNGHGKPPGAAGGVGGNPPGTSTPGANPAPGDGGGSSALGQVENGVNSLQQNLNQMLQPICGITKPLNLC